MNERFRKLFISTVAVCCSVLLLFPVTVRDIYADGNSYKNDLTWIVNNPYVESKKSLSSNEPYSRIRVGTTNTNSLVTSINVYSFNFYSNNTNLYTVFFYFSDTSYSDSSVGVRVDTSADKLNWTYRQGISLSNFSTYIANVEGSRRIYYTYYRDGDTQLASYLGKYMPDDCPTIDLRGTTSNLDSILYLFSTDDFSYIPWNFSTSSGGLHFSDGTDLSPDNTSKYSQVYIVMDNDNNSSVSEEEVNYYNYTYNTNYDYSEINEGNNFTELEFLHWIALQIANGNDDPGGGSGSGGGSDAIGGGITVGDGSFTQSQTQTIEENAINVTVNNDNSLNQENTQWLNSIINNNVGGEEQQNAFENAIGSISGFTGVARSFATLAGVVLGFLPSWVTTLLAVTFAILFVFIVFRLIHLFI